MKSETTIRRELRAVEVALDRMGYSDFTSELAHKETMSRLFATRATLKWMLGKVNQGSPQRLNGKPTWGCIAPASQRPLVHIMDKHSNEINAKAGLYERRKDKRRA